MRNDPKVMVSLKLFVISFVHSQGRTESLRAERKGNRCGSDTCNRRKYKSPSFWEHLFSNWITARGEQVTKRCVWCGDLEMEGVSTHCLLHCRLWGHQVERQSTCGDISLQLFCFQFFNGQTSSSLLKENEESGDFKRTTWGRAKTRSAKLYCK